MSYLNYKLINSKKEKNFPQIRIHISTVMAREKGISHAISSLNRVGPTHYYFYYDTFHDLILFLLFQTGINLNFFNFSRVVTTLVFTLFIRQQLLMKGCENCIGLL